MNNIQNYDYNLPDELIAKEPLSERDAARLLVVQRATGDISHRQIRDLPTLLNAGDCLVVNDTHVIPAKLHGERTATGGRWEGLYLNALPTGEWRLMSRTRGKLQQGEQITLLVTDPHHRNQLQKKEQQREQVGGMEYRLTLQSQESDSGIWRAIPETGESPIAVLERFGTVPLPPYIGRKQATENDWNRYQTVFSQSPGAVAAPTAGLHFTPNLLAACEQSSVSRETVTLHVGIGTFRPLTEEAFQLGRLHSEWCEVTETTAENLNNVRKKQGRIIAVGTTSVRTLEATANERIYEAKSIHTDIFIQPPYPFHAIDGMLTNFHLPRSSLLVLVGAYLGHELLHHIYETAIREEYRFYSYGDAMLIL